MKRIVLLCVLGVFGFACRSAMGGTVNVGLGAATGPNGISFTGFGGAGDLNVDIGACPFVATSVTCTPGNADTGDIKVDGSPIGTYSLSADSSLVATFSSQVPLGGVNTWLVTATSGTDSDPYTLSAFGGVGTVTGAVDWTKVVENTSGVFMDGTATYSGSGVFSKLGSGSASIAVELAGPLSCNFATSSTNPCTLATIADVGGDPPAAFSPVGSGTFGSSTTPEPGSFILLGSGLLGLGGMLRRRRSA